MCLRSWHYRGAILFLVDIISAVGFDASGDYLAVGDQGGRIVIFERKDGKNVRIPSERVFNLNATIFSPVLKSLLECNVSRKKIDLLWPFLELYSASFSHRAGKTGYKRYMESWISVQDRVSEPRARGLFFLDNAVFKMEALWFCLIPTWSI